MKKFNNSIGWNCKEFKITRYASQEDYKNGVVESTQTVKGNAVTMNGLMTLWHLATKGATPANPSDAENPQGFYPFNPDATANNEVYIGVGDGNAVSSVLQNTLKGSQKAYKKVTNAVYSFVRADSTNDKSGGVALILETSFEASDANFEWKEWGIFNGNPDTLASGRTLPADDLSQSGNSWSNVSGKDFNVVMLNRRVEVMGTKQQGAVWTVQVQIELNNAGTDSNS